MAKLLYVHYLRAIASVLVVVHHILSPNPFFASPLPHADFGAAGVALFFVISGFIVYRACHADSVGTFAFRRILRVVPLYWLFTTLKFVTINYEQIINFRLPLFFKEYLLSLLFIPHENYLDGKLVFPLLFQGWTLNIEMLFYAVFAVALGLRRPLSATIAIIALLMTAGPLVLPNDAVISAFSRPILALFIGGMAIACLSEKCDLSGTRSLFSWGLVITGISATLAASSYPAAILMNCGAVVTVLGAAARGPGPAGADKTLFFMLGSASYSLYLTHTFLFAGAVAQADLLATLTSVTIFAFLPVVVVLCLAVSISVHVFVERPMLAAFRRNSP